MATLNPPKHNSTVQWQRDQTVSVTVINSLSINYRHDIQLRVAALTCALWSPSHPVPSADLACCREREQEFPQAAALPEDCAAHCEMLLSCQYQPHRPCNWQTVHRRLHCSKWLHYVRCINKQQTIIFKHMWPEHFSSHPMATPISRACLGGNHSICDPTVSVG